jgi:hypothetical protein
MSTAPIKAEIKDGDQAAFACPEAELSHGSFGLTKREYFAGLALQGILAGSAGSVAPGASVMAAAAITLADALLEELVK